MARSTPVDGFALAYDRPGAGDPVVLLHGWPGDRTDYDALVPLLNRPLTWWCRTCGGASTQGQDMAGGTAATASKRTSSDSGGVPPWPGGRAGCRWARRAASQASTAAGSDERGQYDDGDQTSWQA